MKFTLAALGIFVTFLSSRAGAQSMIYVDAGTEWTKAEGGGKQFGSGEFGFGFTVPLGRRPPTPDEDRRTRIGVGIAAAIQNQWFGDLDKIAAAGGQLGTAGVTGLPLKDALKFDREPAIRIVVEGSRRLSLNVPWDESKTKGQFMQLGVGSTYSEPGTHLFARFENVSYSVRSSADAAELVSESYGYVGLAGVSERLSGSLFLGTGQNSALDNTFNLKPMRIRLGFHVEVPIPKTSFLSIAASGHRDKPMGDGAVGPLANGISQTRFQPVQENAIRISFLLRWRRLG